MAWLNMQVGCDGPQHGGEIDPRSGERTSAP